MVMTQYNKPVPYSLLSCETRKQHVFLYHSLMTPDESGIIQVFFKFSKNANFSEERAHVFPTGIGAVLVLYFFTALCYILSTPNKERTIFLMRFLKSAIKKYLRHGRDWY